MSTQPSYGESSALALPRAMQPGSFYVVAVDLNVTTRQQLQSSDSLSFEFNLQLITPYVCSSPELTQSFQFVPEILPTETDATEALAFGEPQQTLNREQLSVLRMEILTALTRILASVE